VSFLPLFFLRRKIEPRFSNRVIGQVLLFLPPHPPDHFFIDDPHHDSTYGIHPSPSTPRLNKLWRSSPRLLTLIIPFRFPNSSPPLTLSPSPFGSPVIFFWGVHSANFPFPAHQEASPVFSLHALSDFTGPPFLPFPGYLFNHVVYPTEPCIFILRNVVILPFTSPWPARLMAPTAPTRTLPPDWNSSTNLTPALVKSPILPSCYLIYRYSVIPFDFTSPPDCIVFGFPFPLCYPPLGFSLKLNTIS